MRAEVNVVTSVPDRSGMRDIPAFTPNRTAAVSTRT